MKTNKMRKAKAMYSEFAVARWKASITCVWRSLKSQQRRGELSERGGARCDLMEVVGSGKLEVAD